MAKKPLNESPEAISQIMENYMDRAVEYRLTIDDMCSAIERLSNLVNDLEQENRQLTDLITRRYLKNESDDQTIS